MLTRYSAIVCTVQCMFANNAWQMSEHLLLAFREWKICQEWRTRVQKFTNQVLIYTYPVHMPPTKPLFLFCCYRPFKMDVNESHNVCTNLCSVPPIVAYFVTNFVPKSYLCRVTGVPQVKLIHLRRWTWVEHSTQAWPRPTFMHSNKFSRFMFSSSVNVGSNRVLTCTSSCSFISSPGRKSPWL